MTKKTGGVIDHIGADLWQAFRAYERVMYERVSEMGFEDISLADSDVLVFVGPAGAQLVEIARQRRVSKQAVHEQVHSLVERGYLTLQADPDDRRSRIARHSPKGRALVEALNDVKREMNGDVGAALGPAAFAQVKTALNTIRELWPSR